ncbi:WD40 repeat domain-containing protein [Candidatus Uabimicrobium sp. HlEnr_7]|uniref:WD40 repeat domain-containing protein n=1 Tax=Candidatus Uabimicrobium helgolandensis TaxID=3095367 RepID=UPI00355621FE
MHLSNNEELLAVHYLDGKIGLWDLEFGRLVRTFDALKTCHQGMFSADGKTLTTVYHSGIKKWRVFYRHRLYTINIDRKGLVKLDVNYNGRIFASRDDSNIVQLWNASSGKKVGILKHQYPTLAMSFHQKKDILAVSCSNHRIYLWDIKTKQQLYSIAAANIEVMKFSPIKTNILTYASHNKNFFYDIDAKRNTKVLKCNKIITAIAYSQKFFGAATAKSVTLWNLSDYSLYKHMERNVFHNKNRFPFSSIFLDKKGNLLARAERDIYVLDISTTKIKLHVPDLTFLHIYRILIVFT